LTHFLRHGVVTLCHPTGIKSHPKCISTLHNFAVTLLV